MEIARGGGTGALAFSGVVEESLRLLCGSQGGTAGQADDFREKKMRMQKRWAAKSVIGDLFLSPVFIGLK
jgi:hypothetical protein